MPLPLGALEPFRGYYFRVFDDEEMGRLAKAWRRKVCSRR